MFRASLTVRSAEEAGSSIEKLRAALEKSDISVKSKSFLIDSACGTLELWRAQLARPNLKSLKVDKILEGSDYRVVLKVRPKSGIVSLLQAIRGTS